MAKKQSHHIKQSIGNVLMNESPCWQAPRPSRAKYEIEKRFYRQNIEKHLAFGEGRGVGRKLRFYFVLVVAIRTLIF